MARSEVVRAVRSHLAANWSRCPVVEENTGFSAPKDGSPFVLVQFPYSNAQRVTFGAPGRNIYRETGAFVITVNVARGKGVDEGREWVDRLGDLFRGRFLGGVQILAPNSAPTDNGNETGNYFQLVFAVPYRFDYLG